MSAHRRPLLLVALSTSLCGLWAGACTTTNNITTIETATDGGGDATQGIDANGGNDTGGGGFDSTTGGDTGAGDDASGGGDGHVVKNDGGSDGGADTGSAGDSASAVECGALPTLHQDEAGTIFCGFDFDAGVNLVCPVGQECCLGGAIDLDAGVFAPQSCATFGTACTNPPDGGAIAIECGQNADCTANGTPAGAVCCLQGATAPAVVPGCGYYRASLGTAIACEAPQTGGTCAAGEVQICSSNVDCPSGKTCTPTKWKIFQVGFCL
ncbi:MAG TPA: hypothetical protein VIF15_12025 [Polyangiaceae bacterium]